MKWRPIKYAPRDGTPFILGRAGRFGFVAPAMFNRYGVLQNLDAPDDPSFFRDIECDQYGELVFKLMPRIPRED